MMQSITDYLLDSFTEITQNPISVTIFSILSLLIISLILASVFSSWRALLIRARFLEEDEKPSSLLIWIIGVIILVKLVQTFLVQPFIVDGGSMLPTFHNKEFLLVDKLSYRLRDVRRGDVMIFKLYEGENNDQFRGKHLIKRVIGLPTERVVVNNGKTTIYNKENPEGFVLDEKFITYKDSQKNVDITLDEHHYFMMGDNRGQSYDSRDWGPLNEKDIRGQVLLRVFPLKAFDYEAGRIKFNK